MNYLCSVPANLAPRLAEMARSRGCEALISPHCTDPQVKAISVVWKKRSAGADPTRV